MGVSGTGCSCLETKTHTHTSKKTADTLMNVHPSACLSTIIHPRAAHLCWNLACVSLVVGGRPTEARLVEAFFYCASNRRAGKQFASYAAAELRCSWWRSNASKVTSADKYRPLVEVGWRASGGVCGAYKGHDVGKNKRTCIFFNCWN